MAEAKRWSRARVRELVRRYGQAIDERDGMTQLSTARQLSEALDELVCRAEAAEARAAELEAALSEAERIATEAQRQYRDMVLSRDDYHQRWVETRSALRDALDGMVDMRTYVPDYNADKWDHDGHIARAKAALDPPSD